MNKSVRKITDGAMLLAIIGIFVIINRMSTGLLSGFEIFVLPFPFIYYVVKYGMKPSSILAIASILLCLILADWITLFYIFSAILVGMVYGYGLIHHKDSVWILFTTGATAAISSFIEMYVLASALGYNMVKEVEEILALAESMGRALPPNARSLLLSMYPIVIILYGFSVAVLVHTFSKLMLKRLNVMDIPSRPLIQIKLPLWLSILATLGVFSQFLTIFNLSDAQQILIGNVMTVSIILLVGDSFIPIALFGAKIKRRIVLWLVLIGLFILPEIMIYVLIGVGLLDAYTDLRQRIINIKP